MKKTSKVVLALLIGSTSAQAPEGTAAVDCGTCDEAGYNWWVSSSWLAEPEVDYRSCDTTADCNQESDPMVCSVITIGGINQAVTQGKCVVDEFCITVDRAITDSANTWSVYCNAAAEGTAQSLLDVNDSFYWNSWIQGGLVGSTDSFNITRDTCTEHADCAFGDTCGTITLDNVEGLFCVPMAGWCAAEVLNADGVATGTYTDGNTWTVPQSSNTFVASCTSDSYLIWFWQQNNTASQAAYDDCTNDGTECTLISWDNRNGTQYLGEPDVAAFCGTASMNQQPFYRQIGCYPSDDCETLGGYIPGPSYTKYGLECASLLTTGLSAQVPTGTAAVDCGNCDPGAYYWWTKQSVRGEPSVNDSRACNTNSDCVQIDSFNDEATVCLLFTIGGINGAVSPGRCEFERHCGTEPEGQASTYCNTSAVGTDPLSLDINDNYYWNYWIQGGSSDSDSVERNACTVHADCGTGETCGTITLDNIESLFCVPMNWCADYNTDGLDTGGVYKHEDSWTVPNSLNKFGISCNTDEYLTWFWQVNDFASQATAAGCATVDPECTTITWGGIAGVEAFCGTAVMRGYSQLGCYPTADCETLGGNMPGSDTIKYELLCAATQLAVSAAAAITIAASI